VIPRHPVPSARLPSHHPRNNRSTTLKINIVVIGKKNLNPGRSMTTSLSPMAGPFGRFDEIAHLVENASDLTLACIAASMRQSRTPSPNAFGSRRRNHCFQHSANAVNVARVFVEPGEASRFAESVSSRVIFPGSKPSITQSGFFDWISLISLLPSN
jgi:hypothetical protein